MRDLLVDIDGCICQYNFAKLTKKWFGTAVPNTGIATYSLEDSLGVPSKMVCDMFKAEAHAAPNMIRGAKDVLQEFITKDYNVFIYTNRLHFMTLVELEDWLDRYEIPYNDIIGNGTLPSYIHAHIDDSPSKLLAVDEATTVKHRILFSNPWNKHCLDILGKFERANNWQAVRRLVYEGR